MWLEKLEWFVKIERIMSELPDKYLEPRPLNLENRTIIPPGSQPIGQLTEGEKRLMGVFHQLFDSLHLEVEAHNALHEQDTSHSPQVCREFYKQRAQKDRELWLIINNAVGSLKERFGVENEYLIDGHDVYVFTEAMIASQRNILELTDEWPNKES